MEDEFAEVSRAEQAITLIIREYNRATQLHGPFHSAHEGFAVLMEEVDELWDEVKKHCGQRSTQKMTKEAVQVAAMALRFLVDVCLTRMMEET